MRALERVDDRLALQVLQGHGLGGGPWWFRLPWCSRRFRGLRNGEVGGGDERALAGDEAPLDRVLQLADISRPRVPPQQLEGVPAQRDVPLAHLHGQRPDERVGQKENVVSALP